MTRSAIFLDRDGVINCNRSDHVKSWDEFEFLPGVLDALVRLARMDLLVIVISNQGVIGRGLATRATVDEIHDRMIVEIHSAGGRIDDVFYCPHRPEDGCTCRKPQPGLLLRAAERWHLDLATSILIGDSEVDALAAQSAGCRSMLVRTGRGAEQLAAMHASGRSDFSSADDLSAAVDWLSSAFACSLLDSHDNHKITQNDCSPSLSA